MEHLIKVTFLMILLLAITVDCMMLRSRKKRKKHRSTSSDSDSNPGSDSSISLGITSEEPCFGKHCDDHKRKKKKHRDYYYSDDEDRSRGKRKKLLDLTGHIRQNFAYEAIRGDHSEGVICSPVSALMPVGMLVFGSEGRTLSELLRGVGVSSKSSGQSYSTSYGVPRRSKFLDKHISDHFKDMRSRLKSIKGFHIASRIYIDQHHGMRTRFKEEAEDVFDSCIEEVDMRDSSGVAHEMNKWVRYHTDNKIRDIANPSDITSNVAAIILDAIYFWGKWKYPFHREEHATFHGQYGQRSVRMMSVEKEFKYGRSDTLGAQVIEIPYRHDDVKLIILLPFNTDGLDLLVQQLSLAPELINRIRMSETKLDVTIPKFKIESELDLGALYERVGMSEMFNPSSGLSRVIKGDKVYVGKAIQKAYIVVDEEGTEAAGLGGAMFEENGNKARFRADHPFLFFVTSDKQQLFAGALT